MKNISIIIGKKLKKIRYCKNITIGELSEKTGISAQQLSRYERGYTKMNAEIMYKIIIALNCSINLLFSDLPGCDENDYSDEDINYLNTIKKIRR